MTLLEILSQFNAIKNDLIAKKWKDALRKFAPLIVAACDVLDSLGVESNSESVETMTKIQATLEDCKKLCEQPKVEAGVEKIGDGKIRDFILQLIGVILPIFIK